MTATEITAALAAAGVHLDPWDETFRDGKRPLDLSEVCTVLSGATDWEIASWTQPELARRQRCDQLVV